MMPRYDVYKDSGIEWIGEIPDNWSAKKIKYLAKICNGKDYRESEVEIGGFPVYGTGGVFARSSQFLYSGTSVLLGRKGTIDRPLIVNGPFWTSDTMYYTHIKVDVDPKYFYYLVMQIDFKQYSYGSAVPSMTKSVYDEMAFPYCILSEQTQIVEYLDAKTYLIDKLISVKQRKIELLKEKRTALINHVVTKGLDPNVKMKESGDEWIGEIPEHWEVTKLGFYTTKIGAGSTPSGGGEVYSETGVPFIRSQNVLFSGLNLESVVFVDEEIHNSMRGTKVGNGDVLLNITGGSIGRCCVVETEIEMNVNQHVSIIRTIDKLNRFFLNYLLQSELGQSQVRYNLTGGNREGLTIDGIRNFNITLPENDEQTQIVEFLNGKTTEIDNLLTLEQKKIDLLKEYRQSLISEVVTGKIKVTKD